MTGFDFAGRSWSVAAPAMLWGLLGVAIPIVIHLLNRRRADVVDWAAMQFLEQSQRAYRRFTLTEILLMLGRMAVLALVALAVARPLVGPPARENGLTADVDPAPASATGSNDEPRDVVLILDGSQSMDRRSGDRSARQESIAWAKALLGRLAAGSSVAILDARERVSSLVLPPSFDLTDGVRSLEQIRPPRGGSDLPAALTEALRLLESTRNAHRDAIVLTDGQRRAWRPGETARWSLIREVYHESERRKRIAPRIWAVMLGNGGAAHGADGAVTSIELSRTLAPPGLPVEVTATVTNAGRGALDRTAELLIDGAPVPLALQQVGPLPPGGKAAVSFQAAPAHAGGHLVTVRLNQADDPQPANDEASRPLEVADGIPVVLIDGEPGLTPLEGETGFVRAALTPAGDESPAVRATVVPIDRFDLGTLRGARVAVLADVERLSQDQEAAVMELLAQGGGILIAPGNRTDLSAYGSEAADAARSWLPAQADDASSGAGTATLHPAPASFSGSWMAPFAEGSAPPLARARFTRSLRLKPAVGSSVLARFDSGDAWIVERGAGRGRVLLLAAPLDAEAGTLPVNPDFVPWLHTLIFRLADPAETSAPLQAGKPIRLEISSEVPASITSAGVRTPDGQKASSLITHSAGQVQLLFDQTDEPGVYSVERPLADGSASTTYVLVEQDPGESDAARLETAEAAQLSEGWPLEFLAGPEELVERVLSGAPGGPKPAWRWLVLLALCGLCVEVLATRAIARLRTDPGGTS
jgi:hypothetical protein